MGKGVNGVLILILSLGRQVDEYTCFTVLSWFEYIAQQVKFF